MEVNIESSEDWDLVHQTLPANYPGTMIDVYEQLTTTTTAKVRTTSLSHYLGIKHRKNEGVEKFKQYIEQLFEGRSPQLLYTTNMQLRKESMKKNSGVYGIRTLDLYDTGAALYQLS